MSKSKQGSHSLLQQKIKTVKTEIEDTRRWKDIPTSWIQRTNLVKWQSYQKQSTDSMKSQSVLTVSFTCEPDIA